MSQSQSQSRRNAAATPATPAPAAPAPAAPAASLLASLTAAGAVWNRPEPSEAPRGSGASPRSLAIQWSAETLAIRERLNPVFSLPERRMQQVAGSKFDLVAAPIITTSGKKLQVAEALSLPIPTYPAKANEATLIVTDLINGFFRTPNGNISLPMMRDGEGMPLANILAIFEGMPRLYDGTTYFKSVGLLLSGFARCARRYAWLNLKDECVYVGTDVF